MMSLRTDAGPESLPPFTNGRIDNCLLHVRPHLDQALFQLIRHIIITRSGNLLNSFFARLKRVMQLASVSSCAWNFLTHFRRTSSRIIRTAGERWMPVSPQFVVFYDVSEVSLPDREQGH